MDIKQLEFFVIACERGSLSQAAACMYTSQPNVSKTIRSLEHELGRPLLERSGKGVSPTAYGETVFRVCKDDFENYSYDRIFIPSRCQKLYSYFYVFPVRCLQDY